MASFDALQPFATQAPRLLTEPKRNGERITIVGDAGIVNPKQ
jgi:hypothetical protein